MSFKNVRTMKAGAKSARLSDGTDDYSSKTSESWDE